MVVVVEVKDRLFLRIDYLKILMYLAIQTQHLGVLRVKVCWVRGSEIFMNRFCVIVDTLGFVYW